MPWRAPGSAPVSGSGCGISGGNDVMLPNGGGSADGVRQGADGLLLPRTTPTIWPRGSVQEAGFGILANHGGGYSYRLCRLNGSRVDEACFQRTPLRFNGHESEIRFDNRTWIYDKTMKVPAFPIKRTTTQHGTWPVGSEWARIPIPSCNMCNQAECGTPVFPNTSAKFRSPLLLQLGYHQDWAYGGLEWFEQQVCAQSCSGINVTACPPGMLQFQEPANGLSGFFPGYGTEQQGFAYSVVDKLEVPAHLPSGDYLLSWRWDAEQSHQIWQSCADVRIVDGVDSVISGVEPLHL
eukprot:TRINITY_DN967_c0_g1_i1.p1 TRINITY_DN967_c0_g1~~TRINITY_DN967_c0_g1_i1.p1  ORF type:complete len:294 (+),score=26.75 TRINITY_DN967_c0_g1_i1:277-1158(+)